MKNRKILITGGAGFIGSAFARLLHRAVSIVVDKLTYAGDLKRLLEVKGKFKFYKVDVCNKKQLEGGKIPVYGKGQNVRQWLYVDDCARGVLAIMNKGKIGQIYNLGSPCESRNINTVKLLLKILRVNKNRFEFVKDRLGHDIRYSLDSRKITSPVARRNPVLNCMDFCRIW